MEVIGESIEGGLSAELNCTEEITAAVNTVLATSPPRTPSVKRELAYALELLQALKEASVKFMKSFHAASLLMNEVTAEVGLAEGGKKEEVLRERMRADEEADAELKDRVGVVDGDWDVIERAIKEALDAMRDVPDEPSGGEVGQGPPVGATGLGPGPEFGSGPGPGPRPGASALERAKMRNQTVGSGIPYQ